MPTFTGTSADETITPDAVSVTVTRDPAGSLPSGASDAINAGAGNDLLAGGSGSDFMSGGSGDDIVFGDDGDDFITGDSGNDTINGGGGSDTLYGEFGDDRIVGGGGNDKLYGSLGDDVLKGGYGKDQFIFAEIYLGTLGVDTIRDFKPGKDTIAFDLTAEIGPELNRSEFVIGRKAKDANDYIVYNEKKGMLSFDGDGKGGDAALAFARVGKNLDLDHKDFEILIS